MTAEEVLHLVESGAAGKQMLENGHGSTLRRCMVSPRKIPFADPLTAEIVELWLVLEEDPERHTGYMVVYDDVHHTFGLALNCTGGERVFLGLYGDFLDAYLAM